MLVIYCKYFFKNIFTQLKSFKKSFPLWVLGVQYEKYLQEVGVENNRYHIYFNCVEMSVFVFSALAPHYVLLAGV